MAQPFDYGVNIPDPAQAFTQAFQMGTVITQQRLAQEEAQKKQLLQTELANLYKNPNASATDYARVAAFLPTDQAKIVTEGFARKTKEQQQDDLLMGGQVYSAIKAGSLDIAERLLTQKATALRNSNRENEAVAAENALELIKLKPEIAQATIGLYMAKLPGGTEYLTNADKALSTIRAEALAPAALREALAKADKALADAITAQETAKNAPEQARAAAALVKAQAEKAQVDAKYAEQITLADLKKKAADLGLTNAQTGSALAQTRKLGVETSKIVFELEALKATGGVDPAKNFDKEEKLRKEYQARTKVYGELGNTYSNIESSANAKTGPGDIALITGFMKMLDPGSVVRETEFATARDTAGLYTRLENSLKKAETGQFLQPKRQEFVTLAKQYLDSANKKAGDDKKALGVVVKNYKLNPENVFGPETEAPAFVPPPAPTGMFGPAAGGAPAAGQKNVTVNY